MEHHSNLRLLFIALCLVISASTARSRLAPDASPGGEPVASPLPSESLSESESPSPLPSTDFSLETIELFPVSESPSESESEPTEAGASAENKDVYAVGLTSDLHALAINPGVKKICDQTDHPSLCMATVLPFLKGKPDVDSVLQVAVQAGSEYAKVALSEAKKLVSKPGTPADLLSTLKDCKDGYDTAVENFQKTLDAFAEKDVGTMRSMLSAVITFVGDCQDEFQEMQVNSPLTGYAQKLTEMTSNCLAIASLMD